MPVKLMNKILLFVLNIVLGCFLNLNAQVVEIIVETNEGGQNVQWYKEIEGQWFDSVAKSTAPGCTPNIKSRFGDEYHKGVRARFQPNIPVDGDYEIFVTWWRSANCNKAKYIIHYDGGEKSVLLMQDGWGGAGNSNANIWISLGIYPLKAGNTNYVELTDSENDGKPDPANNGRIYADAMKFTLVRPKGGTPISPVTAGATPITTQPAPSTPTPVAGVVTPGFIIPTATPAGVTTPVSSLPAKIEWLDNVVIAQQRAMQENKGILVYFFVELAEECRRMENETFTDPTIIKLIQEKYIPLKFDMKTKPSEAYHLGAFRAPTIILYKSDGTPSRRIVGFKPASELLGLLQ